MAALFRCVIMPALRMTLAITDAAYQRSTFNPAASLAMTQLTWFDAHSVFSESVKV